MKINSTFYQIELTQAEIDTLVNALHTTYTTIKSDLCSEKYAHTTEENHAALNRRAESCRVLRNDLAALINRFYAGNDA